VAQENGGTGDDRRGNGGPVIDLRELTPDEDPLRKLRDFVLAASGSGSNGRR
jgi:hypothetical protein